MIFLSGTVTTVLNSQSDVAWFRDGALLEPSATVEMSGWQGCHSLILYDLGEEDAGEYECVAVNATGEKWQRYTVLVMGKLLL